MTKFSEIKAGDRFTVKDGATYQKVNDLIYLDIVTGIESYWDPQFDATIVEMVKKDPGWSTDKFKTDPQTRVVIPNPAYKDAEAAFGKLWGSGLFDCDLNDYEFMVNACVKWGQAAAKQAKKTKKAG